MPDEIVAETKTEETPETITTETPKEETSLLTEKVEEKSEGEKVEEEKKAEEVAPLTVDALTLPEGMEFPEGTMDKFLGIMNDKEMDGPGRAQALIDLQAEAAKVASEKGSELWMQMREDWRKEITEDKDIGGTKLQTTLDGIGKLLDTYGTPELRSALALTGAGDSVHVARFLHKIAAELNEPGAVSGAPGAQAKTAAEILYPTHGG